MSELNKYNILFVEDEIAVIESLKRILGMLFKNVYCAADGFEALEILKNNKIDLILTDIKMPKMDGIELIKEIKKTNNNIPIFVTTAYTDLELIQKVKELNINEYFVKPLDIQEVLRSCQKILINPS